MSSWTGKTCWGVMGVRYLALVFLAGNLWWLLVRLLTGARDFDPSYWVYFLEMSLSEPLVGLAIGVVLWVLSGRLGGWLVRGLEAKDRSRES